MLILFHDHPSGTDFPQVFKIGSYTCKPKPTGRNSKNTGISFFLRSRFRSACTCFSDFLLYRSPSDEQLHILSRTFQVFYRVLSGNLIQHRSGPLPSADLPNLGINIVKSKRSVRQGYEFKIMVVIFQLDVVFFITCPIFANSFSAPAYPGVLGLYSL